MIQHIAIAYAGILVACELLARRGARRPQCLAILPLIAVDCLGNLLLLQSFGKTLSGEAWNQRDHPYFGWCWRFINALFFFQPDHCRIQAEREAKWGSVWAAWLREFRGLPL